MTCEELIEAAERLAEAAEGTDLQQLADEVVERAEALAAWQHAMAAHMGQVLAMAALAGEHAGLTSQRRAQVVDLGARAHQRAASSSSAA